MIGNLGTYLKGAIDEVRVYSASFLTGNASTGAVSSAAVFTAYCDSLPLLMQPFIDTMLCQGGSFNLGYSGGRFFSGNTVIVQLSNSSGSFANAVTIGSVSTTTTPGTISCTIPVNTPLGTGYRIRIRSTNLADTTDNNGKNIRISGYPFVSAISNSPICAGTSLFLAASGTAGSVYSWTGPGGFNSSVQNPVIANAPATASGDYIASATLFGCTSKDTVAATVYATPATLVASANTPLCAGDTLKLNCNNAGAGASHSWTGPGSFSSPAQNPVLPGVAVSHSGDYILTASLNGCIKNDTVTVLVKPMPAIPSVNNNGPLCDGDTLQLFAQSSTPGVSYSWTGPAYSSSQQNPVILNASTLHTGSYLVTATLNGCTTAPIATYAVVNLIPATPSASSNSPVCAGGVLNLLSSSATAGVNYIWSGPNNFTSNQQNPVISPAPVNGSGNYTVVAELNGCTSSGSGTTNVVVSNVSSLGVSPSPNDTL